MTITFQHVNPAGTRVFMGTLTDGVDLLDALADVARRLDVQTGTVELLGGLTMLELRAFDFASGQRRPPLTLHGALEVVAGHGAISLLDGAPHVHLHLAVAVQDEAAAHGVSIVAGHVTAARAFAVEFTLTAHDGAPVQRSPHPATGLALWNLPELI